MFFFDDPFDYDPLEDFINYRYNRQRRQPQYRPRNVYYDPIEERLNQVLREEFGLDPYHRIDINRRARQLEQQRERDAQDHSALKKKVEDEVKEETGADIEQAPPTCYYRQQGPYQSYVYSSNSSYNNGNYVEEHREKVTDADGKVHQTTRRRLGDRWYQAESTTDENGKTTSKETWHNVPEDEIEKFKSEWSQQHENQFAAIKHEKEEEKTETKQ